MEPTQTGPIPVKTTSAEATPEPVTSGTPAERSEVHSEKSDTKSSGNEADALRHEIGILKTQLDESRRAQQKLAGELGEFNTLFPDTALSDIPEEVWNQVKQGIPLTASYALYEKKAGIQSRKAEEINRRNASLSAGIAGQNTSPEFYTPDEVRAMSRSEVHNNYDKILRSMKKWN